MIAVLGTFRFPPEALEQARPLMRAVIAATLAEPGCRAYSYAEDVAEPGLIHVFEVWRDQAALEAHFATPHMGEWRAQWPSFGVSDRRLTAYEVAAERPL